jgi:hypothetical protein
VSLNLPVPAFVEIFGVALYLRLCEVTASTALGGTASRVAISIRGSHPMPVRVDFSFAPTVAGVSRRSTRVNRACWPHEPRESGPLDFAPHLQAMVNVQPCQKE